MWCMHTRRRTGGEIGSTASSNRRVCFVLWPSGSFKESCSNGIRPRSGSLTSLTLGFLDHPYRNGTFRAPERVGLEMTKGLNLMGIIHPYLCIEIYPIKTHNRVVQFPTKTCVECGYHRLPILNNNHMAQLRGRLKWMILKGILKKCDSSILITSLVWI